MIFIAEAGLNHNGNIDLCAELIRQASESGADIVKFQLGWKSKKGELNFITEDDLVMLENWSNFYEIKLMFSIFNEESLELSKAINLDCYKVASRTVIDNPDLVKRILSLKKETFISLGMWDKEELPFTGFSNIKYLWCKSSYPIYPWDYHNFPKVFDDVIPGYSDHTIGIEVPLLAIARGAKIIEKHFTLDKSDTTIRDHALSATPSEFSDLVKYGRNINRNIMLGV